MTQREKLVELLKHPLQYNENSIAYWHDEHIGELVDLMIANGVIVLPARVGDRVWYVRMGNVESAVVNHIYCTDTGSDLYVGYFCVEDSSNRLIQINATSIGKSVFFTQEEVETAKELLGDYKK